MEHFYLKNGLSSTVIPGFYKKEEGTDIKDNSNLTVSVEYII